MGTIYRLKTAGEGSEDRFIDAASNVDAVLHAAGEYFSATPLTAAELRAAIKSGITVETTAKVRAADAKAAAGEKTEEAKS